jgi:ABC-type transport system involved in multi-copper enzyme maturation permease subunit
MTIALSHSHVVVLVYVVGLLALAFVVFARRDVT